MVAAREDGCGKGRFLPGGRILAAPSWVLPGTLAENACFLEGRVDEVGLLFMETAACLAYTDEELPAFLADLAVSWHAHLPVDLPWNEPEQAAIVCRKLLEKTAFLPGCGGSGEKNAVLHPPAADAGRETELLVHFAEAFAAAGGDCRCLLLENTRQNSLLEVDKAVWEAGFGICPDLGHMIAYGQEVLVEKEALMERVRLVHFNTVDGAGRHLPLTALDAAGLTLAERLGRAVPDDAVFMLELFAWREVEASLPLLGRMLGGLA